MQQDLQSLRRALAEACRERDEMQCALNASRSEFQQLHQRMLAVQSHLHLLKTRLDSLESSRPDWRRVKSFNSQKSKEYLDKLSSAPAPTAAPAAAPAAPAHPAAIGRRKERAAAPAAAPAAPAHPAAIGGKQPAGIHNGAAGPSNGKRPLEPAVADGGSGSADAPIILTSPQKKRAEANRQAANAKRAKRAAEAPAAAPAAVPIQDADSSAAPGHPRASPRLAKAAHQPGKDDCGGCGIHMPWDRALSSVTDHRHRCTSCNHVVHAGPWVCKDLGRPDTTLVAGEGFYYCDDVCHAVCA